MVPDGVCGGGGSICEPRKSGSLVTRPSGRRVQQENLNSWMLDKLGRDQFLLRYGDDVTIFWNDGKRNKAEQVWAGVSGWL